MKAFPESEGAIIGRPEGAGDFVWAVDLPTKPVTSGVLSPRFERLTICEKWEKTKYVRRCASRIEGQLGQRNDLAAGAVNGNIQMLHGLNLVRHVEQNSRRRGAPQVNQLAAGRTVTRKCNQFRACCTTSSRMARS